MLYCLWQPPPQVGSTPRCQCDTRSGNARASTGGNREIRRPDAEKRGSDVEAGELDSGHSFPRHETLSTVVGPARRRILARAAYTR